MERVLRQGQLRIAKRGLRISRSGISSQLTISWLRRSTEDTRRPASGEPAIRISQSAILLVGLLALGLASCEKKPDAPATIVLYCSVDQQAAEPIIAAFEKESGVRVLTRFDTEGTKTTGLVQRIRSESAAPACDVFWSGEAFHTIRLAGDGLLAPYAEGEARTWPKQFADPNGRWHAFGLRGRVIAYDTRRVKAEDAPRSLEDVLNAKWKGRLVMAVPTFGTTGGDVASWRVHYGPRKAGEILRSLRENGTRLVQGNKTAVQMVAEGRADVCFTDTDDVYAAQAKGQPIAMFPLDQGGEGAMAIPNTVALVAGRPASDAARRLVAFLMSEKVERMLAGSDSHNSPIRPDLARQFPKYDLGHVLKVDYAAVAAAMPEAIRVAVETLQ